LCDPGHAERDQEGWNRQPRDENPVHCTEREAGEEPDCNPDKAAPPLHRQRSQHRREAHHAGDGKVDLGRSNHEGHGAA
jgi:hypothetical protein